MAGIWEIGSRFLTSRLLPRRLPPSLYSPRPERERGGTRTRGGRRGPKGVRRAQGKRKANGSFVTRIPGTVPTYDPRFTSAGMGAVRYRARWFVALQYRFYGSFTCHYGFSVPRCFSSVSKGSYRRADTEAHLEIRACTSPPQTA